MQNLTTLFAVLLPMFLGFFIRVPKAYSRMIDRLLGVLVYAVLFLIGVSVAQVEDLGSRLNEIALTVLLLFACIIGSNIAVLAIFGRYYPLQPKRSDREKAVGIGSSLRQLVCVGLGFVFGRLMAGIWLPHEHAGMYCLMVLVLLIGIQLGSSGISLKQIFLNRRGMQLAFWFMVSSLAGGLLFAALMPEVSWSKGLALASGFGWYSLSGLVMTEAYGAVWGSIMLLNDLGRELFALVFIPQLMRRYPYAAVGVGGATSMDFTLPVIRNAGGLEMVPLAVSFSFVANVAAPLLMAAFSSVS